MIEIHIDPQFEGLRKEMRKYPAEVKKCPPDGPEGLKKATGMIHRALKFDRKQKL